MSVVMSKITGSSTDVYISLFKLMTEQASLYYWAFAIISVLLALCEGNPPVTGGFPLTKGQ